MLLAQRTGRLGFFATAPILHGIACHGTDKTQITTYETACDSHTMTTVVSHRSILMRIMVVGASTNRDKFGNKSVRAYLRQGHAVFPVNPRADEIEGLTCYHAVSDVPGPIDRVTVYLPPKHVLIMLEELALRDDIKSLWLNPGTESKEVIERANTLGFDPITACSIVDIGEQP